MRMIAAGPYGVDDQWQLKLYTVNRSAYETLDLRDMTFPCWIVSFVLSGRVETSTNGQLFHAPQDHVMIHPPHLPFDECSSVPGVHLWVSFDIANAHGIDLFRIHPVSPVVKLVKPGVYSRTFGRLIDSWREPSSIYRDFYLSGLMFQLVGFIMESWIREGSRPRPQAFHTSHDRFIPIVAHMAANLHEKITRKGLAEMVHLNPNYLDRSFQDAYGVNPMQMLREMRLKRAKKLLETSGETLASIAANCGLGDASYLSHQFHKRFGITPGEYRAQVRLTQEHYL